MFAYLKREAGAYLKRKAGAWAAEAMLGPFAKIFDERVRFRATVVLLGTAIAGFALVRRLGFDTSWASQRGAKGAAEEKA